MNTRYFHNAVKHRRRKNKIEGFRLDDGRWEKDRAAVGGLIADYFNNIFTAGIGSGDFVFGCVQRKLHDIHNSDLLRPIRGEEVREALFAMFPDKSPGPDGLSPGFYQHYWDVVGPDVINFCKEVFETGKLPQKINHTNIVLIPKKDKPEVIGDWRPIALCNVIYKIFSKLLANRMKKWLHLCISEQQSAFIPGRHIVDNIILAFESQHFLKRKRQGKTGLVALKLDMSKAYDRVEWPFLEGMMRHLGFEERWVRLVMECVTSVSYSIPFGDEDIEPSRPGRGLRQGDPLSPYLFLLVAEDLSVLLRRYETLGRIHGATVARGAPMISHLFFADDSLLFFRATHDEAALVKESLADYEGASGQVCSGCLPTKKNLSSRRVDCSDQCGLCGTLGESLSHIFWTVL
ncbi:unnamed protein product [Cuscuta europaea]|uniref:Reverse transcriptase domain-containing protein n=2 Tax=Cuscuta europaea TaxID=41803 RepID=A0A9P1EMJ9_CUSEU|nr:unnamed protein product [Cuscuta europaea]